MTNWHALTIKETIKELGINPETGLNQEQVKTRQEKFGKNLLPQEKPFSGLKIFFEQFRSPLIYILAIAGIINFFLGKTIDAFIILTAVFLNTLVGFFQERKAAKTLQELKKIIKKEAEVLREGNLKIIEARDLVPGDILIFNHGDKVAADAKIIEAKGLRTNEMTLTGEWLPAEKNPQNLPVETPLADRDNMIFAGTVIEDGRGKGIVVETGINTEIGKIAKLLKKIEEEKTPYQKKLAHLSKIVGLIIGAICCVIFAEGIIGGKNFLEMFTTAIAVAVAAIPEGLPIAITTVLALGMQRILKKGGLVRRLVSAETLGSASVVVLDKTGTLTEAKMAVAGIFPEKNRSFSLKIALFCLRAFVENPKDPKDQWILRGRPTDKALLLAAADQGLDKKELETKEPAVAEILFNPEQKFSASLRQIAPNEFFLYVLGAPEIILEKCGEDVLERRKELEESAAKGQRVMATAFQKLSLKDVEGKSIQKLIAASSLVFSGSIILQDPIRQEAKQTITNCLKAGIKVVIATGDHKLTALAVAREVGLEINEENTLSGENLEKLSLPDLEKILDKIYLYYRVEPGQKLKIIEAWQKSGGIVAMTGDGINDALALKKAEIGIALGSGTEVAKEAADLVLLNDGFSVIAEAIEEGRAIIDNIRKVITYLLSDSFTEIILIGAAIIARVPLPITAVQILWINLIEDGLPNIALAFEPKEPDIMKQKPAKRDAPLLTPEMKTIIFLIGVITDLILLAIFFWLLSKNYPLDHLRTLIFAMLGIDSISYVFSCKSLRRNLWQINLFNNKMLIGAWLFGVIAMISAIYLKPLNDILGTRPLPLSDWLLILALGALNVILIEAAKYYFIANRRFGISKPRFVIVKSKKKNV